MPPPSQIAFRGLTAAAPLKRLHSITMVRVFLAAFRGLTAAAPLKLEVGVDADGHVLLSAASPPRPH